MPKVSSDMEAPKALNYIEKLVAELCPGGVEYVNLEQCVEKTMVGEHLLNLKRNTGTAVFHGHLSAIYQFRVYLLIPLVQKLPLWV